jgi:hypothetical protein
MIFPPCVFVSGGSSPLSFPPVSGGTCHRASVQLGGEWAALWPAFKYDTAAAVETLLSARAPFLSWLGLIRS